MIVFEQYDETYLKVIASKELLLELREQFTFEVANARYNPKYKAGIWDGKINLLNLKTRLIYKGLLFSLIQFCEERNIEWSTNIDLPNVIGKDEFEYVMNNSNNIFDPKKHQIEGFIQCIENDRKLIISPTSSGKTLIIYLLCNYFRLLNKRVLIIVPTINLVNQTISDFNKYNKSPYSIDSIKSGKSKNLDTQTVISTWQSLKNMDSNYFNDNYDVIIGDEVHTFQANSLVSIMEKSNNIKYRFGLTGTLQDSKTSEMVLKGLFGEIYQTITTRELIDNKDASELKIKGIVLNYSDEESKIFYKMIKDKLPEEKYSLEIDWLINHPKRQQIILKMLSKIKGNTLLLFRYVDKHGKILHQQIKDMFPERKVYFVDGSVKGDDREIIRNDIENVENAIIIASIGVFSTGVSINNLHNLVFCSPMKTKIKTLQSIGRILRLSSNKKYATLYDVCDDIRYGKRTNIVYNHFIERLKYYSKEQFDVEYFSINM